MPMLRMLVAHESDIARQALRRTVLSLGCMVEALEAPDAVAARVRAAAAQGEAFDVLLLDGQSGHHRAAQLIEALCAPPTLAPWPVTLVLTDLAGKAVGEAGRKVGHAARDGAVAVKEGAKKAGKAVAEGARKVGGEIKEGAKEVGHKVKEAVSKD